MSDIRRDKAFSHRGDALKIVMENSSHHLRNMGDLAMLQTTVSRLIKMWPEAQIDVVTDAPELLRKYCPGALPLSVKGRRTWLNSRPLKGRLRHYASLLICSFFEKMDAVTGRRFSFIRNKLKFKLDRRRSVISDMNAFVDAVSAADLVLSSGGGFLTDSFQQHAMDILTVIGLGRTKGKKTALFGQGIGPISSPGLFKKAAAVLPSIDLITLRERKNGLRILNEFNVLPEHIMTTGDDAIELAWKARRATQGTGIGINLRMAPYSEVGKGHITTIRSGIQEAAGKRNALIIPLPISFVKKESDVDTIRQILLGYPAELCFPEPEEDLYKVLEQVGLCRIVITGSYHCAVFSLAQGIPAICLAESQYYKDKFSGLTDQFGCGVEIVLVNDPLFEERLAAAIEKMWASAEEIRPLLLKTACRQIESGQAAYQKLQDLLESEKEPEATASKFKCRRRVSVV